MVQPYESGNETTREETAAAYDKIGQDLGDKVAPVGLAFRRALRERPDLNLYAADGKQASWAGIYLEGCVLYATIFGRSPVGLTYRMQGEPTLDWQLSEAERYALAVLGFNVRGTNSELSEKDAADLQRIAWETVQDYQAQTPQPSNAPAPATAAVAEPDSWPTAGWKISTPEEQGMDSARLAAMFDAIDRQQLNLHSLLIIRNGCVVTEAYFAPYGPAIKHQLASVTKSVTGMLTGIAINQGRIESTGQPVLASFPNRTVANLDQNKRGLTLEHLLTMTGGLDCSDDAGTLDRMFRSPDWVQFTLDLPMAAAPGKKFSYCSPAVHLVSAILGQATGKSERELANETLFAPLGILPAGPDDWAADPQGISEGFAGLALTPRDMAKLGFLYLHGGLWNSQQVIPASWVAASLAPHVADESTGRDYGYLFWIYGDRGIYSALGLGGQDIHIIPAKNMVVVFTAAMDIPTHDEEVIKLLDEYIVPAAGGQPLPANPAAQAQLQARIARAAAPQALPPPLPALARSVSGKVYDMEPNPNGWNTISLAFQEGSPEAVATINGSVKVLIGLDNVYRTSDLGGGVSQATRGHWEGGDTFVIDANVIGNLLQWQSRMTFPDDQLLGDLREQVTGATNTIKGRAAP